MNLIKKLNKILGVMIAGLAVTIIVVASKKGLIKWSNIFNHDNSKRLKCFIRVMNSLLKEKQK